MSVAGLLSHSWRTTIAQAKASTSKVPGVLCRRRSGAALLTASAAVAHDTEPALAVAGTGVDANILVVLRIGDDGTFDTLAQFVQPDTVCSLAWRGDLLLAASYNGVVYMYAVPTSVLQRTRKGPALADEAFMHRQTPRQIVHSVLHVSARRRNRIACIRPKLI